MTLVTSGTFLRRVEYLAWYEADAILDEDLNTYGHTQRLALAHTFLSNPAQHAPPIALAISRSNAPGRVIVGTVIPNENPNLVDSSAPDLALSSAITFYWNSVAQVEQAPEEPA